MAFELIRTKPPAKPDDVPLRIYSHPICPYAQRARLIARAKGIKHEIIDVHLQNKPNWFLELNSFGAVPVIEHNGHVIRESVVAFGYIDAVFGDSKLWPSDPYKRAQSELILNDCGSQFTSSYYKYYGGKQDENTPKTILKFLKSVEAVITQYGGPFIMGNQVSAIDLLIWPWFERLPHVGPELVSLISEENAPLINKWIQNMKEVDAVKHTALPPEGLAAFTDHLKTTGLQGTHDYSLYSLLKVDGLKIYIKEGE